MIFTPFARDPRGTNSPSRGFWNGRTMPFRRSACRDRLNQRVFTHANYYLEMQGRPIPVRTNQAWTFEQEAIVFL